MRSLIMGAPRSSMANSAMIGGMESVQCLTVEGTLPG